MEYKNSIFSSIFFRIILIIWAAMVIYPLLWMILGSFKNPTEIFTSPWALPESFGFGNYQIALEKYNLGKSFLNSMLVTALASALNLLFAIPTAYAIERIRFRGSKVVLNAYLAGMMIPSALGWIPLFFLLNNLNMLNNLVMLAVIYAVTKIPFSTFILCSFIGSVPRDLEESAAIDGLSSYGILFRIVTPLIRAGVITVTVMNVIAFWSEYFMAMLFIRDESKMTLGVAMDLMNWNATYQNAWGALFAGLVIVTIPMLVLYALLQKYIVKGMVEGALKG